ncbi:tripartite tricarboxylate transporter substrate binding protein [Candidimonas humi]|uniref:Bug family tripartite tricarboxylate transporter substrate binding protein n=1 Tax=Candidimonas humi TaxID=683355 RepID=A0ABV8P3K7_9BURK|nr:tripartite tricarboxylate transporter substrate binding protein [Candidimonas humi]MBV6303885.1 tripartite tricarboxylate transporter substrate binding protein [Candidimonas humi]
MNHPFRRMAALLLFAFASTGAAAAYPDHSITLVHGFGAGGNADSVARVIADAMGKKLGQTVVVDPRTGAGGTIASAYVSKAKPDGYTLVMLTGGHTASAAMRKELPYDPVASFSMISTVSRFPFVISVKADNPAKDLKQLLDQARAHPGTVTYTSVGVGSTQHLTGELLASKAGVSMVHVPYRGGGAPVQAVLSGDVNVMVDTPTVTAPQLQSGKLRALGVTSPQPWPLLPGVPTVGSVIPGFTVMSWLGIAGPADMPQAVVDTLNHTLKDVLADQEVQKRLHAMGSEAWYGSPGEMRDMIATTTKQWIEVVKAAKIPLQ